MPQLSGTGAVNWFITGGTGFIGREVLARILQRSGDEVFLLVRNRKQGGDAETRIDRLLDELMLSDQSHRVHVVCGDCVDDISINENKLIHLCKRPVRVLHMAADTNFSETLERARQQNLSGTQNVMRFAQTLHAKQALDVFAYVSTAYVAGHRKGTVYAYDLDTQANFRNSYEQSKSEAEAFVRSYATRLPTMIFRPSIVVGDSRTGRASGANTIYWAIKLYLRGQRTFFARRDSQLDLVPVDYVADAMLHILNISKEQRRGQCFPLVAGQDKSVSLGELSDSVAGYFQTPSARCIAPVLMRVLQNTLLLLCTNKRHRVFLAQMKAYLPYFSSNPGFNDGPTRRALSGSGITAPVFESYGDKLFAYCEQAGWARKVHKLRRRKPELSKALTQSTA